MFRTILLLCTLFWGALGFAKDKLTDFNEEERREYIRGELINWYRKHVDIKIKERVEKYESRKVE